MIFFFLNLFNSFVLSFEVERAEHGDGMGKKEKNIKEKKNMLLNTSSKH